jgi:hypothetical protein
LAFILVLGALLFSPWRSPLLAAGLTAPPLQGGATTSQQLFLTPLESTAVTLQTHIAELTVTDDGQGGLTLTVDAVYRLDNPGDEAVNLLVRLEPDPASASVTPAGVALTSDGAPVSLQPAENGGYSGQIAIGGGQRVEARLVYSLPLDASAPVIRYDARNVGEWPGQASLRIALTLPASIPPATWLNLSPDDWSYQVGAVNGVKWLYDQRLPDQPIVFQFIHPAVWSEINAAQQAVAAAPLTTAYVRLGDIYRRLYDGTTTTPETAERFFAQALAAYAEGVDQGKARGASAQELAPLYAGEAALYRTRIVDPRGAVDPDYVQLMVQAARAAAQGLPEGDAQRAEMNRWRQEGLNILLDAANARRDWPAALALIDELATLPPEVVDQARLEEARRTLRTQQALQLLEEGDRNAAIALAGPEIVDASLEAPAEKRPLFASWQVTMTAGLDDMDLIFLARPAPGREEAAAQALADQVQTWKDSRAARRIDVKLKDVNADGGVQALRLEIGLSGNEEGETLAALVKPIPQWAFLRSVLEQAKVEGEQAGKLIWRETTLRQRLNLRTIGDQWDAMAASLRNEATRIEQAQESQNDPEAALRARIQAINYHNAAQAWEKLAGASWAVTTLRIPAGLRSLSRSWLTTVTSPPQTFEFSAQAVSGARLLIAAALLIIGLILLTALLWWLL